MVRNPALITINASPVAIDGIWPPYSLVVLLSASLSKLAVFVSLPSFYCSYIYEKWTSARDDIGY